MFGRRRNGFDNQSPVPSDGLTKYDEKYIFSTDTHSVGSPQSDSPATVMSMRDISQPEQADRELPMVFRLRSNSDIYVYEYRDRLEYFLKTDTAMCGLGVRKK